MKTRAFVKHFVHGCNFPELNVHENDIECESFTVVSIDSLPENKTKKILPASIFRQMR